MQVLCQTCIIMTCCMHQKYFHISDLRLRLDPSRCTLIFSIFIREIESSHSIEATCAYHHYSNRMVDPILWDVIQFFVNPIMWKVPALIILEQIQFIGRTGVIKFWGPR